MPSFYPAHLTSFQVVAALRRRDAPRGRDTRPLLQSCVAEISRHARQGVITIYTAANEKAHGIYREISAFLAKVASASQLGGEQRRQLIIAYALRKYGIVRRLFSPLIGRQATLPLR